MLPSFTSPTGVAPTAMTQNGNGAHLLARHEWLWADGSEAALQGYVDHYDLEVVGAFRERRRTVDFDFQHHPRLGGAHDIVWGLGYRESTGVVDSGVYISLPSGDRIWRMASVFMQDEFTLKPDLLRVVLGARLEHNNLTGFEPQPNARLVWTPTPQQTVWGAVSGAVRTPSRAEQDAVVDLSVIPGNQQQPPVLMRNVPLDGLRLDGEKVKAFELGFRQQFGSQLSLDLALFNNRYNSLRTATLGATSFEFAPVPHVVQAISPANGVRANTKGFELALDWHASKAWRIQPAYSTIRIHASADTADPIMASSVTEYNNSAPRHQLALRSSLSLSDRGQFDFWLRHVSALPSGDPRAAGVPAYTTLDLRVAWRVQPGLELSLVGQNLLDRRHVEFIPDLLPSQTLQVQRSVYVKAKWQF